MLLYLIRKQHNCSNFFSQLDPQDCNHICLWTTFPISLDSYYKFSLLVSNFPTPTTSLRQYTPHLLPPKSTNIIFFCLFASGLFSDSASFQADNCCLSKTSCVCLPHRRNRAGWSLGPHLSSQLLLLASCMQFYPNCMCPEGLRVGLEYVDWEKGSMCTTMGKPSSILGTDYPVLTALGSPMFFSVTPHLCSVRKP